ncbi:MAG: serine endoprotease DegQ [Gammaproteobacteria bacterium CG22_combo_CG10-13_8_21_14_all_40_8]|nr:MAG: serine endoprotease DegQ [Gammaproteobacteria bacterium CG22_combo_CG10-13_8_21_14_all_40_8]
MFKRSILGLMFIFSPHLWSALPSVVEGKELPSLAPMIEKVSPAVVNISSTRVRQGPMVRDPFWGRIYRLPAQKSQSLGSGVIVNAEKGYILTNHHVIEDANEIMVHLSDGRQITAKLIGSDKASDIAVIQIEPKALVAIQLFDSDNLRVGDFVVAIGNPFNLGQSVTSGIVSAVGRQGLGIEDFEDFIQTDAAINPGNSGGALVNLRGELVGINTAIIGPSGGNVGIGFAIPINLAYGLMQQLLQFGHVRRSLLGIEGDTLTPQLSKAFDISETRGVVVTHVAQGSSAAKAGMEAYDIILAVDGRSVVSLAQLNNLVGLFPVGKKFELEIIRNGQKKSIAVELSLEKEDSEDGGLYHKKLAGVLLKQHEDASKESDGVLVLDLYQRSEAALAGLMKNDVIVGVGRYRCHNLQEFKNLLAGMDSIQLRVWREDQLLALRIR